MKQESRGEEYESTGWDRVRREEIWRAGWSGRRLGRGESGFEGGIGLQASRESADESDHGGMPKATEAKGVHLREGLLGGPVLKGDAIGSDEDAGAVFAEFAMDKDFLRRGFAEEREELRELWEVGLEKPPTGMCTKRKPRDSARCRSFSRVCGDSRRRSTMVVMPRVWSCGSEESVGCAPRKS